MPPSLGNTGDEGDLPGEFLNNLKLARSVPYPVAGFWLSSALPAMPALDCSLSVALFTHRPQPEYTRNAAGNTHTLFTYFTPTRLITGWGYLFMTYHYRILKYLQVGIVRLP
ncbi:hypothetical protein KL86CLO1_10006 [uncultured Eubacteriales bacterium]|uniref:Uncharacterized protein n=1 Tax=uncultured Eubacteriales bacterium TaxID=172733 RepID=A0A212ITT6_9FIRM|nr:hypothetical protein KL86CLO1_10006 [uncultured Eubacteriales bacterium]